MVPVDDEAINAKLGDEIDHHGANLNKIGVPVCICQCVYPPGRDRGKNEVIHGDLKHRERYVFCRFERKLSIDGEVENHRQCKRYQVAQPFLKMKHLKEQRERGKLNHSRRAGEEKKLQSLKEILLLCEFRLDDRFLRALRLFRLCACRAVF